MEEAIGKKIIAFLAGLCLIAVMLPTSVFAEAAEKTEFVAVSRYTVKTIDDDGVITFKTLASKPDSEDILELQNGYPIIFAKKQGEGEKAVYTVIQDQNKVTCKDSLVCLYTNER